MVISASAFDHVVMFPFPAQGHIAPFVQLSKRLASYGVTITFVTMTPNLSSLQKALAEDPGFAARDNIRVVVFDVPKGYEELSPGKFDDLKVITMNMNRTFEELIESLVESAGPSAESAEAARIGPPLCIISDFYLGWTQDVANKFQVPRYCFFPSPAYFLSFVCHMRGFVEQGRIPARPHAEPFLIPGFPPIAYGDLPVAFWESGAAADAGFTVYHSVRVLEVAGMLVNSVYELESEAIEGLRDKLKRESKSTQVPSVLTIGPLMDGMDDLDNLKNKLRAPPDEDECLQWLERQPAASVLYVSFGSVAVLTATQIDGLARGLEASGQRFLWVVRVPADVKAGPGTDISHFLPKGFMERTKDRGLVFTAWAPQLHILAHPAVGGFMTHCGWNSAIESIVMGVPMIAWPLQADQKTNALLISDLLRTGVSVHRQGDGPDAPVAKEEVERVIRLLMQDEDGQVVRKKVEEVSAMVGKAAAAGGSSQINLNLFLSSLKSCKVAH